jgi:3-methyladenine DNA glycosylase AlkC
MLTSWKLIILLIAFPPTVHTSPQITPIEIGVYNSRKQCIAIADDIAMGHQSFLYQVPNSHENRDNRSTIVIRGMCVKINPIGDSLDTSK